MSNNTTFPTSHYQPYDHSISDPSHYAHRRSKNELPGLEPDTPYGTTYFLLDTHHSGQDSDRPDALSGSSDWEFITHWTSEVTTPSSHVVLGGVDVLGVTPATYPTYSCSGGAYPLHTEGEFVPQTLVQPSPPRPPDLPADNGVGGNSYEPSRRMELEWKPVPGIVRHTDQPPFWPPSARPDHDGPPAWPKPYQASPTSGQRHHDFIGLLQHPSEGAPPRRSVGKYLQASLKPRPADGAPTDIYGPGIATVPSSPIPRQLLPINWTRLPQETYTSGTKDGSFSRRKGVTFGVNKSRGFNMQDALNKLFTGLDGRDDHVLEDAGGPVSCRLLFPGYPPKSQLSQIAVKDWRKPPVPITKSKLAYEIAKRVGQYLHEFATTPMNRSGDPRWKIGQGGMRLERMYLVSIVWVSRGSIQPEIWVDEGDDSRPGFTEIKSPENVHK